MKTHAVRIIAAIIIIEAAYLALANLALQLPVTQTLVNSIKPEKFAVTWEKAWTWYPFRVHARGVSANGQTGSQQWQAEAPAASASVSILPLLTKTVRIHSVVAADLEYYQRPRPRPGKDYAATRAFFPPIKGREVDRQPVTPAPKKKGNGWKITVEGIHATGNHGFWVYQMKGKASGDLQASVNFETRGGPFSLDNGEMDINIQSLSINDEPMISSESSLEGTLEFAPFVPSENKGIRSMAFLKTDVSLDAGMENLDFLNFYLRNFQGMTLGGNGRLSGRLIYKQGTVLPPTSLAVIADRLHLDLHSYKAGGSGDITIHVDSKEPEQLGFDIRFATIDLVHQEDDTSHFTGENLVLATAGSAVLIPWDALKSGIGHASVSIPLVKAPDLRVYQRYIPTKLALVIEGGEGELEGRARLTRSAFDGNLDLRSTAADISLSDYRFRADLAVAVNLTAPEFGSGKLDISGTSVQLNSARLIRGDDSQASPWNASVSVDQGHILVPRKADAADGKHLRRMANTLQEDSIPALLDRADAHFTVTGNVSELGWLDLLFTNTYNMSIFGSGDLTATLNVEGGQLARDSNVRIQARDIGARVLDYEVKGNGLVTLQAMEGGDHPDLGLQVRIDEAILRRVGEEQSYIQDVSLDLEAQALDMRKGKAGSNVDVLRLKIPRARIPDMSAYNEILPANSPLQLLGGRGDLKAAITLTRDMADGYVRLTAQNMRARIDEQQLAGDLQANILIQGGTPENMDFDISGTSISLDNVRVHGESAQFDQDDWSAEFQLNKARTIWKKPVFLHAEAEAELKDSRPFVALFTNHKGKHKWIEKMLTVEDIQGTATMTLENQRLAIPHAFTSSDRIDAGVKGIIDATQREGIFYVRHGRLDAILEVREGDRDIDIIGARKKFDAYSLSTDTVRP